MLVLPLVFFPAVSAGQQGSAGRGICRVVNLAECRVADCGKAPVPDGVPPQLVLDISVAGSLTSPGPTDLAVVLPNGTEPDLEPLAACGVSLKNYLSAFLTPDSAYLLSFDSYNCAVVVEKITFSPHCQRQQFRFNADVEGVAISDACWGNQGFSDLLGKLGILSATDDEVLVTYWWYSYALETRTSHIRDIGMLYTIQLGKDDRSGSMTLGPPLTNLLHACKNRSAQPPTSPQPSPTVTPTPLPCKPAPKTTKHGPEDGRAR